MMNEELIAAFDAVADAVQKVMERISEALSDLLPPVIMVMEESEPAPPRPRWKPVRYIRVNDRRTDRRPPVHHIRSALPPNKKKERRMNKRG